jgi:hypothetical protein
MNRYNGFAMFIIKTCYGVGRLVIAKKILIYAKKLSQYFPKSKNPAVSFILVLKY